MSQHRQATDPGPSRLSVVFTFCEAVSVAVTTVWILAAPGDDPRHLAGGLLGFSLAVTLVARWAGLLAEREAARRRAVRAATAAERLAAERARTTGTWHGDEVGQALSVRYDRATASYFVQGWLGDDYQIGGETRWVNVLALRLAIDELESSGELEPVDDEGTRFMRQSLCLDQLKDEIAITQPLPPSCPEDRMDEAEPIDPLTAPLEEVTGELPTTGERCRCPEVGCGHTAPV